MFVMEADFLPPHFQQFNLRLCDTGKAIANLTQSMPVSFS
jgi:hypothetical protein